MDVYSFGLMAYEILTGKPVFPTTMSAATTMRRAMSAKASDRPVIPDNCPPVLRELITRSWNATASKRPTVEALVKSVRDNSGQFQQFPGVKLEFLDQGPK
jgi:serine/threonine protein kinase